MMVDKKIERLNLVLRTIRNVYQLLVKEKDWSRLLQGICDNFVENWGYHNAWIVQLNEAREMVGAAEAGIGEEFASILNLVNDGALTECANKALRRSSAVITEDPLESCNDCPLSKKYEGRAGIALRLEHDKRIFGLLCVSIQKEFLHDYEEHELLEEIAGDIAYALYGIEQEKDRKRAEEELHNEKELAQKYLDVAGVIFVAMGTEGDVTLINKKGCKLLGYEEEDIIGKNWFDHFLPERLRKEVKSVSRLLADGKVELSDYYENPIVTKTGEERLIAWNNTILRNEVGTIVGHLSSGTDITEQKMATESLRHTERELRESEQNFRDLVDKSLTGISIVQDDRVIYRNPEQKKILGEMPLLFTAYEHIHPEDIENVKSFYQTLVSGEAPECGVDIRFYQHGNTRSREDMQWVHCRANIIEYKGKDAILANLTDIKKTKELEQLLGMQDKLVSLGRVAAGIAHEIRNPLSGINIYLNTLEKIYDDEGSLEKVKQIVGQLQSASRKIESVIKRVMDFAKPGEPVLVSTNLNKSVQEAIDLSSVTLRKSGIRIEQALDENLPPCNADTQLVTQVVLNLISNASEAMKKVEVEKKVRISTFKEGDKVTIGVSDSGPGVPPDLREKIFDPFYTTSAWSTGIGLSICKRIISDHGGSIRVVDSDLGGAEFKITIPASKGKERK